MGDKSPKAKQRMKKQDMRMKNEKKAAHDAKTPRPAMPSEPPPPPKGA